MSFLLWSGGSSLLVRDAEGGVTRGEPIGDWASHPADAFRTMAEAHRAGLIEFKHSNAQAQGPGWVFNGFAPRQPRRGMKPQRVSAMGGF